MLKSLLAAITAFFVSFTQPTAYGPSSAKGADSATAQERSYFSYVDEYTVQGQLYVGENEGISTDLASKRYYLQIEQIDAGSCLVQDSTLFELNDITDRNYLPFTITFATPRCMVQTIVVSGKKLMVNKVGEYSSTKSQEFGPVTLTNMTKQENFFISLTPKDHSDKIKQNATKSVIYKITDPSGAQIPSSKIKSIIIRTLDSDKILILDPQRKPVYELVVDNPSGYGEFDVLSKNRPGPAPVEIEVSIASTPFDIVKRATYTFYVEKPPVEFYDVALSFDQKRLRPQRAAAVNYQILINGEVAPQDQIQKVIFEAQNGYLIKNTQEKVKRLELDDLESAGMVYVEALSGVNTFSLVMSVDFVNGIHKEAKLLIPVADIPIGKFVIAYVGTEYDKATGLFIDTYSVHTDNFELFNSKVRIGVLNPKILYEEVYYDTFLSGALDQSNPYIYYEDIYTEPYTGVLERFVDKTLFKTQRFDLLEVTPSVDKVMILPNKMKPNTDKTILGLWDVVEVLTSDSLVLKQRYDGPKKDRLSFVIGNETRYDPTRDTIAMVFLDRRDGIYQLSNEGETTFRLYYPSFFAGKDLFFSVTTGEGKDRIGNSFKRTLTGTNLIGSEMDSCASELCVYKVKITFEDTPRKYQYANFARHCKVDGKLAKPLKFTSTLEYYRAGCSGSKYLQKTDANGDYILCVWPMRTQAEANATTPPEYEQINIECEYTVAEEFPY
ncbi:MAG: hypothetical protein C6H99_01425 [Epsilonproteobacteria bacterium]|nr:hypothetical protein [Campylobacterota bacterium]NPA63895.1 hypothetical protein [Campylobacterota bacterium]